MQLIEVVRRTPVPEPWAEGDTIPWNEPGFSARMLKEHFNQDHDAASRRTEKIERHVSWIHSQVLAVARHAYSTWAAGPACTRRVWPDWDIPAPASTSRQRRSLTLSNRRIATAPSAVRISAAQIMVPGMGWPCSSMASLTFSNRATSTTFWIRCVRLCNPAGSCCSNPAPTPIRSARAMPQVPGIHRPAVSSQASPTWCSKKTSGMRQGAARPGAFSS
jgi:hypothetical protein